MTPADTILAFAQRAAQGLDAAARTSLLAACRKAAQATAAALDSPDDAGAELALEVRNLLGALAMLEAWGKPLVNHDPARRLTFAECACPELAERAAEAVEHVARAVIAERRSESPVPPLYSLIVGNSGRSALTLAPDPKENPEHVRMRRAIVAGSTVVDWIETRDASARGMHGGTLVTAQFFVPQSCGKRELAGDLGGPEDRMIAEAARQVTGEAEPEAVIRAMLDGYVKPSIGVRTSPSTVSVMYDFKYVPQHDAQVRESHMIYGCMSGDESVARQLQPIDTIEPGDKVPGHCMRGTGFDPVALLRWLVPTLSHSRAEFLGELMRQDAENGRLTTHFVKAFVARHAPERV